MLPNQPAAPAPEGQSATPPENEGAKPLDFDEWIKGQDESVKGLITTRFQNLENAAKARREERETLANQFKELKKSKDEELRTAIDEMGIKLEDTERRASFLEEALNPALQVKNARALWLLAKSENHFKKNGAPDWDALRAEAPELFGIKTARANAGNDTENPPGPSKSMNAFIRSASGRSPT